MVVASGHGSAVAAIAPRSRSWRRTRRGPASTRSHPFPRHIDRRIATQLDERAAGVTRDGTCLLTPIGCAPGGVDDDRLAECEQRAPAIEEGVVGHGRGTLVVETLPVLGRHPRARGPARRDPSAPRRSAARSSRVDRRPAASVDLPVPGSPPTSASTTRPRCRWSSAICKSCAAWSAAPASPWLARRHATLARTWAR